MLRSNSKPVSKLPSDGFQNNAGCRYCILLTWSYIIITQFSVEGAILRLISLWSYKTRHKTVTFRDSKIRLSNLTVGVNITLSCLDVSALGLIKSFWQKSDWLLQWKFEGPKCKGIVEFHQILSLRSVEKIQDLLNRTKISGTFVEEASIFRPFAQLLCVFKNNF